MSELFRRSIIAAACAALTVVNQGVAQTAGRNESGVRPEYRELRARADSLMAQHRRLSEIAKSRAVEDSIRKAMAARDLKSNVVRIRVGPLTVIADSGLSEIAEAAAQSAYEVVNPFYGASLASVRWDEEPLRLRYYTTTRENGKISRHVHAGWEAADNSARGEHRVRSPFRKRQISEIANVWQHSVDAAMSRSSSRPKPIAHWMGMLGSAARYEELAPGIFANLKLGKNLLGRRCINKDIQACKEGFGLESTRDTTRLIPWTVRGTLLLHALRTGGAGAFHRFIADSTRDLSQRLSDASGLTVDSLLAGWHSSVVNAKPAPAGTPVSTALVALGWASILGLVSLRSSRWR